MRYFLSYVTALLVFGSIDAAWLSIAGNLLYRPVLAAILAPSVRIAPALAFYGIYPIGLTVFAILPALNARAPVLALQFGFLFGLMAYATYDLTNYATLRSWTLHLTIIDILYGALASGIVAGAAAYIVGLTSN
jgi:uncharacterized membrane protein